MSQSIFKRILVSVIFILACSGANYCEAQEAEESVVVNFWSLDIYKSEPKSDTIYYSDKSIKAIGDVLITKDGQKSDCRYGLWTFYYPSGKIESEGEYYIGSFMECKGGVSKKKYYSFKKGKWTYYYDTGVIKAEGAYEISAEYIKTSCAERQRCYRHRVNSDWLYLGTDGKNIEPSNSLKAELEYLGELE